MAAKDNEITQLRALLKREMELRLQAETAAAEANMIEDLKPTGEQAILTEAAQGKRQLEKNFRLESKAIRGSMPRSRSQGAKEASSKSALTLPQAAGSPASNLNHDA